MNKNWPKEIEHLAKEIIGELPQDKITPNVENVLRIFSMNPVDIKVVILGQDPYPTKNVAIGRAFATNNNNKIPQSLNNIFNEIIEINGIVHADQTLSSWEKQGVFLLNTALTTIIGQSNVHSKIWNPFTIKVIKFLNDNFANIIWVLWGKHAQQYKNYLNGTNTIIEDWHPSPFSNWKRNKNTFKELSKIIDIQW